MPFGFILVSSAARPLATATSAACCRSKERVVKVAEGVRIVEVDHKAKKLIRVRAELVGDKILEILFSGDFFMVPEGKLSKLESKLKGAALNREEILEKVRGFFGKNKIQTPMITPEDFTDAVMKLKELISKYY